ncbi:TrkH family potassium uptake protein [Acinetobacter lactucae]|uniref:TrkH family potassium uptake protein n=1 Tax=Acinetobacter lactucae TaxID=1785128 RepID=UPI00358DA58F
MKKLKNVTLKPINLSPPSLLAVGFLSFIIIGTILLKLPISHKIEINWLEALFTATSAVTVTGLSIIDTGSAYTVFGQFVIMGLIQLGGLGFMTFAILAALSLSSKIGLKQQIMAQDSLDQTSLSKVTFVAKGVVLYSLIFELIGAGILSFAFIPEFGLVKGLYYSVFFSISAFNNAGFSLFSDSLMSFQNNYLICLGISFLYIIGGLGFIVLMDIKKARKWKKLTANSKLVIVATILINLIAFILIWFIESNNSLTLASMQPKDQLLNAWFQATTPRTAGFNTLDTASLHDSTTLIIMILMTIGGGSLSTASGIKVGTFVILILSVVAFLRRNDEVTVFHYAISHENIYKALAVSLITGLIIIFSFFILLLLEPKLNFIDLMFEVISALCTVGLSRNTTGSLHDGSLFVLIVLMFAGRLGPLTIAYLIATPKKSRIKHANTHIQIG